jgi:hypothetical protein
VLEDLVQHRDDVARFRRENLFQVGELAPTMGQAVAPDQGIIVVALIGR